MFKQNDTEGKNFSFNKTNSFESFESLKHITKFTNVGNEYSRGKNKIWK